jgi:hypothetical protein
VTRLLVVLALVACSGHGPVAHPPVATPDAAAPVAPSTGPSDAECDALLDHAIALHVTGDPRITDADRAKLRADLRDHALARCREMPRPTYACAVAAATVAAFTACEPAPSAQP